MEYKNAKKLLAKYHDGKCTPEEKAIVDTWFLELSKNKEDQSGEPDYDLLKDRLWAQIQERNQPRKTILSWPRIAAAAILCVSIGAFYLAHKDVYRQTVQSQQNDVAPGDNRAVLTLSNGRRILLDQAKKGRLATQGNIMVNKSAEGRVTYQASNSRSPGNPASPADFNTFTTPRGGQYQVILSDGSHVWLNDASSIKFPVHFAKNERRVMITGEAYFEVAHDRNKPFRVITNNQTVEVLGTHFNVNSYSDEHEIKTTLLEGSIRISNGNQSELLKPGQQAKILLNILNPKIKILDHINTEAAVAWKAGYFQFKQASLQTIMRQLARWYDVEVTYEGNVPQNEDFTGKIPRDINLSDALKILKFFKVDFRIENKKITITP